LRRVGRLGDRILADLLAAAALDFVGGNAVVDDDRVVVADDVDGIVATDGVP
jgi:hypothetical protein